jgi:uncharacterized protein YyaL (SSP411 family)
VEVRTLANRLLNEPSPYLQQHAHNPVDWYPWGEEALARARAEQRPILLSVGYSACHWCHVMERESFEDPETARLMNERFVNVKVDREERPDLDRIYQTICQLVTRGGGWPLTVFLTPDRKPFFVGTYFPPEPRHGLPGFRQVLRSVAETWEERRDEVLRVADQWAEALADAERPPLTPGGRTPEPTAVARAAAQLAGAFDRENGGFGRAPKFPNPTNLELFLRAGGEFRELALLALRRMAAGGIHDQLGGGFHRYSVDERWEVPHFEKMLYDNALLIPLYQDAWRLTGDPDLLRVARGTADFLLRELRSPEGAFCATLDADSEGEEGRFYLWTREQLAEAGAAELAERLGVGDEPATLRGDVRPWRDALLERRNRRVRPGRDAKVLVGWNGLALAALARLGGTHAAAAGQVADWLLQSCRRPDGGLWRRWKDGRAGIPGTLEDYAYLAAGLVELWEATFQPRFLAAARDLCSQAIDRFWVETEGFYLVEPSADLIIRPSEATDGATPAPGSVMVQTLLRLAPLTGEETFERVAEAALSLYRDLMERHAWGSASLLCALDRAASGNTEILVAAEPGDATAAGWLERIDRLHLPNRVLARVGPGGPPWPAPIWDGRGMRGGRATLYVCRGRTCSLPAHALEEVADWLR